MNDREFKFYDRMMRTNKGVDMSECDDNYDDYEAIPRKCRKCKLDYQTCKMTPEICDIHRKKGRKHR